MIRMLIIALISTGCVIKVVSPTPVPLEDYQNVYIEPNPEPVVIKKIIIRKEKRVIIKHRKPPRYKKAPPKMKRHPPKRRKPPRKPKRTKPEREKGDKKKDKKTKAKRGQKVSYPPKPE